MAARQIPREFKNTPWLRGRFERRVPPPQASSISMTPSECTVHVDAPSILSSRSPSFQSASNWREAASL
eukprot:13325266-Alexandrium_andersonii.AAC.1